MVIGGGCLQLWENDGPEVDWYWFVGCTKLTPIDSVISQDWSGTQVAKATIEGWFLVNNVGIWLLFVFLHECMHHEWMYHFMKINNYLRIICVSSWMDV